MTCMGDNLYDHLEQYGGVCPNKRTNGQTGCLFDGYVYNKGDVIEIKPCLAKMTCLGNNNYGSLTSLGGVCSSTYRRTTENQAGCLFDGKTYSVDEEIIVPHCLGKMTCLGNNNLGPITLLGGICPDSKREVNGQNGCWFDGVVYAKGDIISIAGTNTHLICKGNNLYSEQL